MKKLIITLIALAITTISANATTWNAVDRVATVGKHILEKNGLPSTTIFKVVDGVADNSATTTTNIIYVSSADLSYAGNDNEVAAVVSNEIGHIINGQTTKKKLRDMAKKAINSNLSADSLITTAANSTYVENKAILADEKAADITGVDLMIQAGYNPLAAIVLVTKMPGSSFEKIQGKPSNSERAMNVYDYLTYNYASKVKIGYNCQEYRSFLTYANPIVADRNSSAKKLAKFNKQQAKNKTIRAKSIANYKLTGKSEWETSYELLKTFTTQPIE